MSLMVFGLSGMGLASNASNANNARTELMRGAQMWSAKSRPDIAHQFIKKLLAIDPDAPDTLAVQADLWLQENKFSQARQLLDTLKLRHPEHRATRDLEILVRVYGQDKEKLSRLRLLARTSGKTDTANIARVRGAATVKIIDDRKVEAAQLARELFPSGPPSIGSLGLEYYAIMATSPKDASGAVSQLARIYRETGDSRYQLAQIEVQLGHSKNPNTALRDIERLALDPDVDQQNLQRIWRRALEQLSNSSENQVRLKTFLKRYPGDRAVAELLAAMQQSVERADHLARDPIQLARRAAIVALEQGELQLAQSELETVLAVQPRDAQSLGNLGLVRLRQEQHGEALDLFARADQLAPQRQWKELQVTARYLGLLREADREVTNSRLSEALSHTQQAIDLQPKKADGHVTMAGIKILSGEMELSQSLYQHALQLEPYHLSALRGLARLYAKSGRNEQALALLSQVTVLRPDLAPSLRTAQVDILQEQAQTQIEANLLSPALRSLESALLLAPENAWLRYRLARLYQRLELPHEASNMMNEGVERAPADVDMRHARALIRSALDDDAGALTDIEQIPPQQRSQSLLELLQRVEVNLRVVQAQRPEQRAQANQLLEQAEIQAADDPDLLQSVANAWFRLRQPKRGVAVFERLAQRLTELGMPLALQYASLLNRAHSDTALASEMPKLLSFPGWTAQQEDRLLNLYTDYQMRRIEQLRQAGNTTEANRIAQASIPNLLTVTQQQRSRSRLLMAAGAYDAAANLLEQLLMEVPDAIDLHLDLGNAQSYRGQCPRALEQALWLSQNIRQDAVDDRLALLRLWQRCGSITAARAQSTDLLQRYPHDSNVLLHAARLEQADGQYEHAVALFQRARMIELTAPVEEHIDEPTALAIDDNLSALTLRFAYNLVTLDLDLFNMLEPEPVTDGPPPNSAGWTTAAHRQSDGGSEIDFPDMTPLALVWRNGLNAAPLEAPVTRAADRIQLEIDSIEVKRQSWLEIGFKQFQKNSTDGISTLNGWERPLVIWQPWRYDGHYFLHADQVSLDAGQFPAGNVGEISFGQLPTLATENYRQTAPDQTARGLNFGVGYEGDKTNWDLGTIGLGFAVTNWVGGISQRFQSELYSANFELMRRPLTGSMLSYAGAHDPVTGQVWGGVVATGLGTRIATDLGPYSVSASANYALLSGKNVQDNYRLRMGANVNRDLIQRPGQNLKIGLTLSYWHYDTDLSEFTWGHGGYYSPQRYLSLALPLEWSGRQDQLTWLLRGSISTSTSTSDASDYFPGNVGLQTQAGNRMSLEGGGAKPIYASSASPGVGFSMRAVVEYQQTRHTALGVQLELDRSDYYAPTYLMLYARYSFGPVRTPLTNRPRPVSTYSSF